MYLVISKKGFFPLQLKIDRGLCAEYLIKFKHVQLRQNNSNKIGTIEKKCNSNDLFT